MKQIQTQIQPTILTTKEFKQKSFEIYNLYM